MSNEFRFMKVYRDLVQNRAHEGDVNNLYYELKMQLQKSDFRDKWFRKEAPDRVDKAIAIDAVAHEIHTGNQELLQDLFPGAGFPFVKSVLDELSGLEKDADVRRPSRGYFTTILSESVPLIYLEKAESLPYQVGRTTREDPEVLEALKKYDKQFKAGLVSKGELLTLARYFPENGAYQKAALKLGLDNEENCPMVVGGPASVEMVDKQGHLITMDAMKKAVSEFMMNPRTSNVSLEHTDFQAGWALPTYINKAGDVYKTGVDDDKFWLISEIRDDLDIAKRIVGEIEKGNYRSYSIAGSATKTQNVKKGLQDIMQVDELHLSEIALCLQGVNQGAHFDILKSESTSNVQLDSILNSFMQMEKLELPGYGLAVTKGPNPSVVICTDRPNSLTDAIQLQLSRSLPEGTPTFVAPLSLMKSHIPVAVFTLTLLGEEGKREEELHENEDGREELLKMPETNTKPKKKDPALSPERLKELGSLFPVNWEGAHDWKPKKTYIKSSATSLFKDWLKTFNEQEAEHNKLLEEEGFPKGDTKKEEKSYSKEPWIVNEAAVK